MMIRWSFLAGLAYLLAVGSARAAPNPTSCQNDIDCVATPQCGGDVCTYGVTMSCTPAGTAAKGSDGWCTADTDCKCYAQGARCAAPYCTFTKLSDAPDAGSDTGSGGSGGTTGNAGSGGRTGSAGGGGSNSSGGGNSGCSLAGSAPLGGSLSLGTLGLAVAMLRRRARRRG
jgi:uncharacterized membrane protein YgcG